MSSRSERMTGHTGIERRSRLLREAAVRNIGQWQQLGILGNGGNSDPATPREGRRFSDCKLLICGKKKVTVPQEKATANYVPAAAVIRRWRALSGMTGRKGSVGGDLS